MKTMKTAIKIIMIVVLGMMISAPQVSWAQKKKVTIGNNKPAISRQNKPASKPKPKPQQKPESKPQHQAAYPSNVETESFTVNGVTFKMVKAQGGTFTMGATSEQGSDAYSDEKPAHSVTLSTYYIGQTEVTQELWEAVMGSNPSRFKGAKRPVEGVSWDDCQEFIKRLNALTGKNFRLPTEAEWEFAARGGIKSHGYKYSGSNNIGGVTWDDDATHDVATKHPNELGIYDMSGNVCEWCQDWYGNYSGWSQSNPQGPDSGIYRVSRGGGFNYVVAWGCRVSFRRSYNSPNNRIGDIGLRLALDYGSKQENDYRMETVPEPNLGRDNRQVPPPSPRSSTSNQSFTVNGVSFTMVAVQGGTFTMGATKEQVSDAYSDEKSTHQVTLSSFSIGLTEVTQELWVAVMGSNPSCFSSRRGYSTNLKHPVECVSWDDCQKFINKLNALTGQHFRLPTEAEWEYAARGGNKSQGYKYSGSNNHGEVAWYYDNSGGQTHEVATKQPNELGIYDMSGNVWEWCQDWYGSYSSEAQVDPRGLSSDSGPVRRGRVYRGGSWFDYAGCCRVSARSRYYSDTHDYYLGLRLAL